MSLTLEVYAPPANDPEGAPISHTYTDVQLIEQDQAFVTSYKQGSYTQPNADVPVPDVFLGAGHYLALPEGDWRARVLFNGVTLLNGRVYRRDVEWDSGSAQFRVRVIGDATGEAKRRLQSVYLTDLPEAVYTNLAFGAVGIECLKREEYRPNITRGQEALSLLQKVTNVRSFRLLDVIEAVYRAADLTGWPAALYAMRYSYKAGGVDYVIEEPVSDSLRIFSMQGYNGPTYPGVRYTSGATPEVIISSGDYDRNSITLPDWDGWKLLQNVLKMTGQTLRARYTSFPSEDIEIDLLNDTFTPDTSTPEMTEHIDAAGYTMRRQEADKPRFGFTYQRFMYRPEIITWGGGWPHVRADAPTLDEVHVPPPYAANAVSRWLFDAEGKPLDDDTVDCDFTLANLGTYGDDGFLEVSRTMTDDGRTFDVVEHFGHPVIESMTDERCYLYSHRTYAVSGRQERGLLHRRLQAPGLGQFPLLNPAWARSAFRQYEFSRSRLDTVEGRALARGTLAITDLEPGQDGGGFTVEGWPFQTERVERQTKQAALKFVGVRPIDTPNREAAQPLYIGAVTDLKGEFVDVENDISPEREYVVIEWGWPNGNGARANCFDVDWYDFRRDEFRRLATHVRGLRVYSFDRSTEDDANGDRHAVYRVRAVMEESGGVIPDTTGPWSEIAVYF